ncbi:MAG: hypothetical protein B6244_08345 [Candidatus Cloacimonetes bacterium 4572_55]|nr:MAG: hypothetical protein B6244_08345 [Candidatus Cloacimonetes bacterium 4572_55]
MGSGKIPRFRCLKSIIACRTRLCNLSKVRFQIPPGVYKIKAKVEDRHNKKSYAVEEETEIAPFPIEKFGLTQIQFAELIDPDSIETPFSKHGYRIAPNADRTFGENRADFFFYSELLSTPENYGDFRIDYRLSNEKDSLCVENGATISVNDPVTPFTGSADISNLKDGTYTLTLVAENLSDHEQHEKVVTHDEFSIVWSQISWGGDYKEAYRQILYIASDEELDGFKKLEDATDEERIDFLVRFWAKRDPIPRTPQNEYMQEHFRRLQYANEAFGSTIPGWRTDMGRIYIKFGEPDEIDRHPFNFDTAPYEIWLYYRCGYRFVFVDENGYGRYNMVEPSTEGTYSTECTNRAYE